MKTHCTAFLGLPSAFSRHNTLKPAGLLKNRVLLCRDAIIKRSILAQYILPSFKADISLFPTGDRLTQISLYISLLHHD